MRLSRTTILATAVFLLISAFLYWGLVVNRDERFGRPIFGTLILALPGYVFEMSRAQLFNRGAPMAGYFQLIVLLSATFWTLLCVGAAKLIGRARRGSP